MSQHASGHRRGSYVALWAALILLLAMPRVAWAGSCPAGGDHTYVGTVTSAHTDTSDGTITYVCKGCGDSYEARMPRGHTWKLQQREPATCTSPGTATFACWTCGATERRQEAGALGHAWQAWTVDRAPTCTSEGSRRRTCSRDASHVEVQVLAAQGHQWGPWETVRTPTSVQAGERRRVCQHDATHVQVQTLAARGSDNSASEAPAEETPPATIAAPSLRVVASPPQDEHQSDTVQDVYEEPDIPPEEPDVASEPPSSRQSLFNLFDLVAACIDLVMLVVFAVLAWPLVVQRRWIARRRRMALARHGLRGSSYREARRP